ncbi:pyridoxamine 5'-phosphate oxidase [Gammaproteobacteria bacterium]|nr:pyridoxamine 5'-phosphate oxidase [Gammaproteobacteria bacterium]
MDIPETLQQDFSGAPLRRDSLEADPLKQFQSWFKYALESDYPAPNAVSLATSSSNGEPSVRTVLVKQFDTEGFVFYTNYNSTKAKQIEQSTSVSLLFPWVQLGRQVIITGPAKQISREASARYFHSRSRGSQLSAWASQQSHPVDSRPELEGALREIERRFASDVVPLPDFWGGYRIHALTYEFWQSRPDRLHDRFRYTRGVDNDWGITRLSP